MKDNECMVEQTTFDEEWYQPYFECDSCGQLFMCDALEPNFCPGCGKKIKGIKCGLITTYYSFEEGMKHDN